MEGTHEGLVHRAVHAQACRESRCSNARAELRLHHRPALARTPVGAAPGARLRPTAGIRAPPGPPAAAFDPPSAAPPVGDGDGSGGIAAGWKPCPMDDDTDVERSGPRADGNSCAGPVIASRSTDARERVNAVSHRSSVVRHADDRRTWPARRRVIGAGNATVRNRGELATSPCRARRTHGADDTKRRSGCAAGAI